MINEFLKNNDTKNNEPNYGVAPPYQFLRYYGDAKIKTQCSIKYWNISMSVTCRSPYYDEILNKSMEIWKGYGGRIKTYWTPLVWAVLGISLVSGHNRRLFLERLISCYQKIVAINWYQKIRPNSWYQEMNFWYQKNVFLDIKNSISWYQEMFFWY